MTPQEREVIDSIFERLKPAASQPRDPEAERHIAELMRQQPYATYVLAQSAYVQEQALSNLAQENEQLKARLADAERQAAQPAQGGFLSSLFGGGAPARPAPQQRTPFGQPQAGGMGASQGGPWGGQNRMGQQDGPQQGGMAQGGPWGGAAQQQPQRGGSGFLGSALTTAAGVAGGMVVGNMLMNAFKGPSATGGASESAASPASSDYQPFGNSGQEQQANYADEGDRYDSSQDVAYDDSGYDGGGDSFDA